MSDGDPYDEPRPTRTEFDCQVCSANNPYPDGFGEGDEVDCNYCGTVFDVRLSHGRLVLRDT